jgi:cellulose synthase/poly-beta-1,6-N-acetylglucosamine synthase-like glycosyltransferase
MEIVFWASVAFIAYVYAGYPLLLAFWAGVRERAGRSRSEAAEFSAERGGTVVDPWADYAVAHEDEAPGVSIVIAVRDEAHRLAARVENLLALEYAGDRQIIVVSDGSTDDPAAALATVPGKVELICLPPGGKAAALNAGVARAHHDILVFADARQTFARDALQKLVARFADPDVGGVTGELLLDAEFNVAAAADSAVAEGVGLYWRYEKALRRMESRIGSTLGATGAIYALRRSLWRPLPVDTILDDVLAPMRAVLAGYKVVFEGGAKAFDKASRDAASESRRKVRTLAGNVQILWLEPRLLVPFRNPVWWQYISHKVGRLLVPYALIAVLITSAALADEHWIYELAVWSQLSFYALAAWGAWMAERSARLALTFVLLNYSAVAGTVAALARKKVWR